MEYPPNLGFGILLVPDCRLYRQFGLDMGGVSELLGPIVWHLETVSLQSADTMPAYEPCHESSQVAVAV
jgi:hypothetical protein